MKKVAILQSNYIPWKGYFDIINSVDTFVFYDEMQFTKRDWRNRNKIKTAKGLHWLSIPVQVKGKYYQKINETLATSTEWQKNHWQQILHNYSKAPFFAEYRSLFEEFYTTNTELYLSKINKKLINVINSILGIKTELLDSSDLEIKGDATEKLLHICKQLSADEYVSGPAAKDYFDMAKAQEAGINVHWVDYSDYPEYTQLFGGFEHGVSVLDLIFNTGSEAPHFMKSFYGNSF